MQEGVSMGKNEKRSNFMKKCMAGMLSVTLVLSATPVVRADQSVYKTDADQLIECDKQKVNKTEKGDITYVISTEKDSIREKYDNKIVQTNEMQENYQDDSFVIADVSGSDVKNIDKMKDTVIEKDYLLEGNSEPNATWQESLDYVVDGAWDVKAIHAENADTQKQVTDKVKIAVLDSGMDKFSAGRLAGSVNFVNPDEDGFGNDVTGHGTAVQNVILSDGETTRSVLEDNEVVELYSVKVLDENNQAPISRIIAALNWCVENEMNVVNMSFGTLAKSKILQDAVERADEAGVLMVAAAGNGGKADGSTVEYPAAYPQVLGIGSVNQKMEVSEFSARGKGVDLVAPGENIPVTVPWGFYGVQSGTSFAAPHVTAVAGILWAQNRSKNSVEIASLLRASANAAWNEQEAGNGMVDLDYAKKIASDYKVSDEDALSESNEEHLTEYAVPEMVQAQWAKGDDLQYYQKSGLHYSHQGLLKLTASAYISEAELDYLYNIVAQADSSNAVYGDVSLQTCRVLHAGRYRDTFSNYVAAERCLYNCVYLIEHQNYTKDQLKEYIHNHYNSDTKQNDAITDARKHLRIIINEAYDREYTITTLSKKKIRELNFLGFALHLAGDTFSHQYVINPNEYSAICRNTRLERLNGVVFGTLKNGNPAKINFRFDNKKALKEKFDSGECVIKYLDKYVASNQVKDCHKYYDDNISFIYDRYNLASKNAMAHLLSLYAGQEKVRKFDPRVFVNNNYTGKGNTGRIPVWNLKNNVKTAGYTPSQWIKSTVTECDMDTAWERLSHW